MVRRTAFRVSGLAGLLAALSLLGAQAFDPPPAAAAGIAANLSANCLSGGFGPGVQVAIEVRDNGGNLVYTTTATTDLSGNFVVNLQSDRVFCAIPVTLRPGMTYTASDGSTTKTLLIENISFDQLDPDTQTATGTAPAGRNVQVSIYWGTDNTQNVYVNTDAQASGDWFVDVGAVGGMVESDSRADAFLRDDGADGTSPFDFTWVQIYVTSLSLSASVPGGAASSSTARAARAVKRGARVRLSGSLSARTEVCVRRKRVRLLKLAGQRSRVLESARTTKTGRYSFLRKVKRTTRFRALYPGDQTCQRSRSGVKTVRVAAP